MSPPFGNHDVVKPASAPVKLDDADLPPALYPLAGAGGTVAAAVLLICGSYQDQTIKCPPQLFATTALGLRARRRVTVSTAVRPALSRLPQWALCMPQWAEEEKQQKAQNPEHRCKDERIHPYSIPRIGLVTAETRGALASGIAIRD